MTHKERFLATIERKAVDRPASWLGLPHPHSIPSLLKYFKVSDLNELSVILNDDIYPVEMPYHSPTSDAIYAAFPFAKKGDYNPEHRTLNSPGFFENIDDLSMVGKFDWPDPSKYISREECKKICSNAPKDIAVAGIIWSAHFQDALAAFGMENALVQMLAAPEMFKAVTRRIVDFYLEANEIFYEATKGYLDTVLIGNDFGAQTGLIVSPENVREFAIPGAKQFVDQAHSYGLKVIHHSCGSIFEIIPDLIEIGVDAIHPIQALAANMDAARLKENFGNKVSFVGGIDVQHLLVDGSKEEIRNKVSELKQLFPTGLVFSPSHEAVLPDIPPSNIECLFKAINS
jgi:uroporphyrinogen decarboxylase